MKPIYTFDEIVDLILSATSSELKLIIDLLLDEMGHYSRMQQRDIMQAVRNKVTLLSIQA